MDPLTLEQVAADAAGTLVQGDPGALVHGVSTDSRTVEAGRLFIPLVGERFDGHSFIGEALARGARATLASTGKAWPDEVLPDCGVIVVDDRSAEQTPELPSREKLVSRDLNGKQLNSSHLK